MNENAQLTFAVRAKRYLKTNIRQYTMIIALFIIWSIFAALTDGMFLSSRNLSNLLLQTAAIAILAMGMVLVMVAAHIDLSVGSLTGFMGGIAAVCMVKLRLDSFTTIIIVIVVGAIIGAWQGYWVAYRGVPAFIVTLAGQLIFRGGVIGITKGASIAPMNDSFKAIGQSYLPQIMKIEGFHDLTALIGLLAIFVYIILNLNKRKSRIKYGFSVLPMGLEIAKMAAISIVIAFALYYILVRYLGIPYAILLVGVLAVLFTFLTDRTTFGRHVYAIGGNKEAAKYSGINIEWTTLLIFILMGVMSAISGIVSVARLNSSTAQAGQNNELEAIAAAIIGGTSTLGGEGTIPGALIGALVMASLDNGLSLMNLADVTWQYVAKGMVLLIAVWVDISTRNKKG